MQKQTSLYIPTPCHEDWGKMTPTQQGKFCAGCCKQVVDFSLMSDRQILNFLSDQSGKLCGRFDADQLQRPLVETKIKKKKSWWMALTMPLLFLFERSTARENVAVQTDTAISPIDKQPEIMGKLVYQPTKEITVTGKVVDEENEPVPFVTIIQKGTRNAVAADSGGNFTMLVSTIDKSVVLTISSVGYEETEKQIEINENNQISIGVTIKTSRIIGGEIAIVVGGLVASKPVTTIDTIKTFVEKILNISPFKIYPNPAREGNNIHLELKEPGKYQLQILDDQSRLIKAEEINTASGKSTVSIQIPSNMSAGIYYLRLIDERKKKSYTEKFIIQ